MTENNVTHIKGGVIPTSSEASEECIAMLEAWLARAKRHELVSLTMVGLTYDKTAVVTGISRYQENTSMMVGGLAMVQIEMATAEER